MADPVDFLRRFFLQEAPKEKLLVYSVKEGWEPLCKFLGKGVPEIPFPHENVGGANMAQQMNQHKYGKRKRQQTIISLIVFMLVGLAVCYCLNQYPVWVGLFAFACLFALMFLVA